MGLVFILNHEVFVDFKLLFFTQFLALYKTFWIIFHLDILLLLDRAFGWGNEIFVCSTDHQILYREFHQALAEVFLLVLLQIDFPDIIWQRNLDRWLNLLSAYSHYILVQSFILIQLFLLKLHIAVLLKLIHFLMVPKLLLLFVVSIILDFLNWRLLRIFFLLCVINSFIDLELLNLMVILFRCDCLNIVIDLKLIAWILWEPGFISSFKLIRD